MGAFYEKKKLPKYDLGEKFLSALHEAVLNKGMFLNVKRASAT